MIFVLTIGASGRSIAAPPVDYLTRVKPILSEKCYSCHGVLKQESELRLETRALMIAGGDSGEAIVPGRSDESSLLQRITASEFDRMPPADEGAALKADEIDVIRRWIDQGAMAPDEQVPLSPSDHWAFRKIERPDLPASRFDNAIDALLEAKRAARNLVAVEEAPRDLAIRRLYLDLIGLPPTPEQLQDQRPWNEIVDELLNSPQHGERWARHWMDVWRYSDWYGLGAQLRNSQKHLWRWRDWIIDSLNDDKGYDRMVLEMLAGDELAPSDPAVVAGTGFLARNYYLFNRTTWLDSTIEHTGKAFLGLTLNCAKCHDHKYDPITQVDYYRFRALLEPHQVRLDPVPGVTDFEQDGLPRVFDDHLDAPTFLHVRGNPKDLDKEVEITPGVPAVLASFAPEIEPVTLPWEAYVPGARDYVQQDHLRQAREKVAVAESELATANKQLADAPAEKPVPEAAPAVSAQAWVLTDGFDSVDEKRWRLTGEGWEHRDGSLHQTQSTRDPAMARLLEPMPTDFELTCEYTTTGGETYKSVTFRFDQSEDGKYSNYVYTSAHAPGPKVQVAYMRGGTNVYPPEGRASRKIEVGRKYALRFAVRDTLVNIWLDGEFVAAYRFPDRRPDGFFSLSAFDATAAFESITIRSLADDFQMTEAKNKAAPTESDLEAAVARAEAKLESAAAAVLSLQATIAADNAKYRENASQQEFPALSARAAQLQAEWSEKDARYQMLAESDPKKVAAAEVKLKAARQRIESMGAGEVQYESIRGSLKALETPAHKASDYASTYSPTSTGRRLALAEWVASRDNPLTARVAVNHVWMRHFGQPLVESVFDFGLRAQRPLHADVLDLLAYEFMESGWSFRHLHRLIVTSEAYRRRSSTVDADAPTIAADPTNLYYWRMNSRRMESQVVRDSLLKIAGVMDTRVGGPSIDPVKGGTRRSIYFKHSRDQQDKFLSMFDDADLLQCYRRSESVVPQQALALFNSELSLQMAGKIAERIRSEMKVSEWSDFVDATFRTLLGRQPEPSEHAECQLFRDDMEAFYASQPMAGSAERIDAQFVHAMLNHNDFVSIR